MGDARYACADPSEFAKAQAGLRQPQQNAKSALKSLFRRVAATLAVSGNVLHARTAEAPRGGVGDAKYAISIERNRCGGGSGSRGAEGPQDTEGTKNQHTERRLFLH